MEDEKWMHPAYLILQNGIIFIRVKVIEKTKKKSGWPRDQYSGPGGGRYTGPGGGLYTGPGGGKYTGPGGGLYTGPGGGLYTGPGGGLYTGPGGGMYTGPCNDHYYSIIPPWDIFIQELLNRGLKNYFDIISKYYEYGIEKQINSAYGITRVIDIMTVYVANAPGEDYDPTVPDGYDSWIDYWNKKRYPNNERTAGQCRNCKKKTNDLDGGHVEYCEQRSDGKWYYCKAKGIYITPLCPECNNPNNTAVFTLDDSDLIKIP